MAWRVPPASGIAASRLEVVARVVGRMLSRRLAPDGTNDVLDVDAWASPGRLASAIVCRFKLRSANDAVRIRQRNAGRTGSAGRRHADSHEPAPACELQRTRSPTPCCEPPSAWTVSASGRRPRRRWSTSNRGRRTPQVMDALAKITVDEVADFAGRYLKPEAARAVLLLPEDVRNVTHGRSRWKKEDAGDGCSAAGSPTPRPSPIPRRKPTRRRRPPHHASARTGAARAPPRLRTRPASDGRDARRARRAGAPAVERAVGHRDAPRRACRSCRCCSDSTRTHNRATRRGPACAFGEALRWNLSAGPLDRGTPADRQLYGDNAQDDAVDVRGQPGDGARSARPRRARRCTCSGPTPRSTAGSIARRYRRPPPAIRRRARFAPRCSAITPTGSTRRRRRRASSPNARPRRGSRACGAPRTACW